MQNKRSIRIVRNGGACSTATVGAHETEKYAEALSHTLHGGDVLALSGHLGTGKTVFVKGLARGLGVKEVVTSPTFVVMKVYPCDSAFARKRGIFFLCHVDAYRLHGGEELVQIGIDDYLGEPSVITVIEWPERVRNAIKNPSLVIRMTIPHKE